MILETDRCVLQPATFDHVPLIIKMFKEPDSNKYIQPLLEGDEAFWLEKLNTNIPKNEEYVQYWSVFHKSNNDFVGTLNLNEFSNTGLVQVGVHLSRNFWNQGFGFELCSEIVDYAFNGRNLPEIHWIIEVEHDVSRKLAMKLGFKPFKKMWEEDCELEIFKLGRQNFDSSK